MVLSELVGFKLCSDLEGGGNRTLVLSELVGFKLSGWRWNKLKEASFI